MVVTPKLYIPPKLLLLKVLMCTNSRFMEEEIFVGTSNVADAKSVWSWRKIVESSAKLLCR